MNNLKVIGKEKVGSIEFTGIEGGFGKDKKAMLVKDIAKIHGRSVREINEVINRNIKRFKNEIDLIDLKQIVPNDLFSDYSFTKAQWGNAKNIYLLSERGYSKLLKMHSAENSALLNMFSEGTYQDTRGRNQKMCAILRRCP